MRRGTGQLLRGKVTGQNNGSKRWVNREHTLFPAGATPASEGTSPSLPAHAPYSLTKGSNQLCPHSCSEGLHQAEGGEASKSCIVEEHDVEIA